MSKNGENRARARRRRAREPMPELKPHQVATIERPECGVCKGLPQVQPDGRVAPARVQRGVFQYTRLPGRTSRSKYDPKTEDAKHEAASHTRN